MRILLIQKPSPRFTRALDEQGHVVHIAHDAADADRKGQDRTFNLVVLDLALIGAEGLTLVKKWRSQGMNARVLVLTPRHARTGKAEILDAGADVLLTQPYNQEELLAQIRALCRRTPCSLDSVQSVFDLEIDLSARSVKRAGRSIELTRTEFELLRILLCNRGKVVTRSTIWQQLYDDQDDITSNVINVCVHTLRAKIDKDFDFPLIVTKRGYGYALREAAPEADEIDGQARSISRKGPVSPAH